MKAVVIGGTHHNTLSMVRSLGMRGVEVDVILEDIHGKNSYVLASRYVKKSIIVADGNEAVKVLRENYPINQSVILCSDDVAALLDENTAHFMDKQVQVEVAQEIGFEVPMSMMHIIGNNTPVVPCYPCVVKPLESIHGGKRFDVCYNENELHQILSMYETNDIVQIQEYIHKDEEIVIDGVSVNGDVIIPGYVLKYRDHLGGTTYSTTRPIDKLPKAIRQKTESMVKAIGYEGLFGIELIESKGEYYFVEINLRNDATTYALSVAGVNLPYVWALTQQVKDYTQEAKGNIREINSMVEFRDLTFVLKGKISLWQWLKDYRNSECKYFYVKDDLQPYKVARNQFFGSLFGKVLKRLK